MGFTRSQYYLCLSRRCPVSLSLWRDSWSPGSLPLPVQPSRPQSQRKVQSGICFTRGGTFLFFVLSLSRQLAQLNGLSFSLCIILLQIKFSQKPNIIQTVLSAHYFYMLSCSVYVSRGLINYNLLRRQEGKKPTRLQGMYLGPIIFFNIFGGQEELTFLSIIRAGCFMLLCKCLGKSKASLLVCHPLTHPHHPLTLQRTGLKSKRQSAAFAVCTSPCASQQCIRGRQGRHSPC